MIHRTVAIRLDSLGLPVRDAIRMAARLGADGVEFDAVGPFSPRELSQTGRRELRHVLRSNGLRLLALGFPTRHGYDHLDRLEDRITATSKAFALAYDLGCGFVVNHIGKIPSPDVPAADLPFREAMLRLASEADRVGVRLAIQTGLDSPEALAVFLDRLGSHGLAVNYAPANLLMLGVDLRAGIERLHPWIAGCHVRDVVRSGLMTTGLRDVAIGKGEIPWSRLFEAFASVEYAGHFTIVRDPPSGDLDELSTAVEFIRNA